MACLALCGYLPQEIRPQDWQKGLGVIQRKRHRVGRKLVWDESKSKFKGRLKVMAQDLFPGLRVTLLIADALLMAWYARIMREGRNG